MYHLGNTIMVYSRLFSYSRLIGKKSLSGCDMRRVIVTPAGRRRYVSLLYKHLLKQRNSFHVWHIWLNTLDKEDIEYFRALEHKHPDWIQCKELTIPYQQNFSIYSFFKSCANPEEVYLRIDDDVVWMEDGFVDKMFNFRCAHPEYFLVYANIVNNAILSHIHDRMGNVCRGHSLGIPEYQCMCKTGWKNPLYAEAVHTSFLNDLDRGNTNAWKFKMWRLWGYERVSINCISWLGSEFATFGGNVGRDEEQWLAVDKPKQLRKMNVIFGGALCAHFAFHTQRDHLDKNTDILQRYECCLFPEKKSKVFV
jgi:hypothetical protein